MESFLRFEFDLEVSKENLNKQELLKVLKPLKPSWNEKDLVVKDLCGGYLNLILRCHLESNPEDSVVVRIWSKVSSDAFGKGIIDRNMEVALHYKMGEIGISPTLLASFKNGVCCDYFDGVKMLPKICKTDEMARSIARKLAEVHAIQIEGFHFKPHPFEMFELGLKDYPPHHPDPEKNEILQKDLPSREDVVKEIKFLENFVKQFEFAIVQCHGDLHAANMMYNKEKDKLMFLDFEIAHIGYQVEDITYFFFLLCLDYDDMQAAELNLPEEDFQRKFLQWYLEKWFEVNGRKGQEVTEDDVNRLMSQVDRYSLVQFFYFAMNSIHFCGLNTKEGFHEDLQQLDFYRFAVQHFRSYFEKKQQLLKILK